MSYFISISGIRRRLGETGARERSLRRAPAPQRIVPGGVWQGLCIAEGGRFALLGTTMTPGFEVADFEIGDRERLMREYPALEKLIARYAR